MRKGIAAIIVDGAISPVRGARLCVGCAAGSVTAHPGVSPSREDAPEEVLPPRRGGGRLVRRTPVPDDLPRPAVRYVAVVVVVAVHHPRGPEVLFFAFVRERERPRHGHDVLGIVGHVRPAVRIGSTGLHRAKGVKQLVDHGETRGERKPGNPRFLIKPEQPERFFPVEEYSTNQETSPSPEPRRPGSVVVHRGNLVTGRAGAGDAAPDGRPQICGNDFPTGYTRSRKQQAPAYAVVRPRRPTPGGAGGQSGRMRVSPVSMASSSKT